MQKQLVNDLLPPRLFIKPLSEVDYYGARYSLINKLKSHYNRKCFCTWKHGWYFYDDFIDPVLLINTDDFCFNHLVHNDKQATFLDKCGYSNVIAAGMPYIYIDTPDVRRLPNSILVMPHHSLIYTNTRTLNYNTFLSFLINLKNKYDHVAVCLHSSCYDKYNSLVNVLIKYNIECVSGADSRDMNSLLRMHTIFSCFEYVTTSSIGSHIIYSAYSGCKTSISEELYYEYDYADFSNDPFYLINPHVLDFVIDNHKLTSVKKKYSFLFTDPDKSQVNKKWAMDQIGYGFKIDNHIILEYLQCSAYKQLIAHLLTLKITIINNKILRKKLSVLNWKLNNISLLLKNKYSSK